MKLSDHTRDIVRAAVARTVRDRQDVEARVTRLQESLADARRALQEAREVERDLAATLAAHAAAVADESAVHQAERRQREKEWQRAGIAGVLVADGVDPEEAAQITHQAARAARNAESSEPLRGKDTEAPARGPRGEHLCCGGPHTAQPRNPYGHAVGCEDYGYGADQASSYLGLIRRPAEGGGVEFVEGGDPVVGDDVVTGTIPQPRDGEG